MFSRRLTVVAMGAIVMTLIAAGNAHAALILVDDFNDGDDQGWTRYDRSIVDPWGPGTHDATSGSYHFLGGGPVPSGEKGALGSIWNASSSPFYSDGFLRVTVRANDNTNLVMVGMRRAPAPPGGESDAWYAFGADPTPGEEKFFFGRWDGTYFQDSFAAAEPFLPGDDWIIEAGAVGDQLSMKVWKLGEREPDKPQWAYTDRAPLGPGQFSVHAEHRWQAAPPGTVDATFDDIYFTFAELLLGDLNQDGAVNGLDVDPFVAAVLGGSYDPPADMNGDGAVDGLDVDPFVEAVVGGGASVVPEPTSLIVWSLLGTIALIVGGWRHRESPI